MNKVAKYFQRHLISLLTAVMIVMCLDGYGTVNISKIPGLSSKWTYDRKIACITELLNNNYIFGKDCTFDFLSDNYSEIKEFAYSKSPGSIPSRRLTDDCGFQIYFVKTDVECYGTNTGLVELNITSGWEPYSYSINGTDFVTENVFPGLPAGVYTFYVRDSEGCIESVDVTVDGPLSELSAITTESQKVICFGESNGVATITASGGWEPYTYSMNGTDFTTDSVFPGLSSGTYTFTVKDNGGCTVETAIFISQPQLLTATTPVNTFVCAGSALSLTVVADGGTPGVITPYAYSWTGPDNLISNEENPSIPAATGEAAGSYYVTITDANMCQASSQITVTVNPLPVIQVESNSPVCPNTTLHFDVNSDSNDYLYEWTGPGGFFSSVQNAERLNFTSAMAGIYTVTARNTVTGCESGLSPEIILGAEPTITIQPTDVNACSQGQGGLITFISFATGIPAPDVQWQVSSNNGLSWNEILGATQHNLSIHPVNYNLTDRFRAIYTNKCGPPQTTNSATMYKDNGVNFPQGTGITNATFVCEGTFTTFSLKANGGVGLEGDLIGRLETSPDNGITWITVATQTSKSNLDMSFNIPVGSYDPANPFITYRITVENNGCTVESQTAVLPVIQKATVNPVSNQTVCQGSTTTAINFTGERATSYRWTNDNTSIGLGASGTGSGIPSFTAIYNATKPEANITVTPIFSDGTGIICEGDAYTFSITVLPSPYPPGIITPLSYCLGATVTPLTATPSGGGTLLWYTTQLGGTGSPIAPTPSSASPGSTTWYASQTDVNGCESPRAPLVVNVYPLPTATISVNTPVVCQNAAPPLVTFTGAGGLAPYTFIYRMNGGAEISIQTTSGNAVSLPVNTASPDTKIFTLVKVSDSRGCEQLQSGTVSVTVNTTTIITHQPESIPLCAGQNAVFAVTAQGTEPLAFHWEENRSGNNWSVLPGQTSSTLTLTNVTNGMNNYRYRAVVSGPCGTLTSDIAVLTVRPLPLLTVANKSVCEGGSVELTATPSGGTWQGTGVSGTTFSAEGLSVGNYAVTYTYTDLNGCTNSQNANVTIYPYPAAPAIGSNSPVCAGATLHLTATPFITGATWNWTGPNGFTSALQNPSISNITMAEAGIYTVTVTVNGCTSPSSSVAVTINPVTTIEQQPQPVNICAGETAEFSVVADGTGPFNYQWRDYGKNGNSYDVVGGNSSLLSLTNVTTTMSGNRYQVWITGACGPQVSSQMVTLTVKPLPICSITGNNNICPSSTNIYSAPNQAGYTYVWTISGNATISGNTNGQTVSVMAGPSCGSYTLTLITTLNGCSVTCSQTYNITDTTAPVWTTAAGALNRTLECTDAAGIANAQSLAPVATDFCNIITYEKTTGTFSPGACPQTGTYTNSWVARDACNNISSVYSQVITVVNTKPPVVPVAGSATVDCPANAVPPTPPTVTDACGNPVPAVLTSTVDTPDPLVCAGTRIYTYTYTDCAGNKNTWSFTYTILEPVWQAPGAGSQNVACPAEATQPTPPTVSDNCGRTITATLDSAPTIPTCAGTVVYHYTYTDCAGKTQPWTFTYTIREPVVTLPAPGNSTVDCLAEAVAPTPPVVTDNCNNTLTPSAPVASADPACGGTKTYTFTYTDCAGKTYNWVYTYTIREPVVTLPAPGNSTVDCLAEAVAPTPPVLTDNCNNTLTPSAPVASADPACGGTKTYTFTYTDCAGKTYNWVYTYTIREPVVTLPAPGNSTVDCLAEAVAPTPPVVTDNCNNTLTPSAPVASANPACGGTKTDTFTYTDCAGKTYNWVYTYTIREPDWQIPASGSQTIECPGNITAPIPPAVTDNCGRPVTVTMNPTPAIPACSGTVVYSFTYTDCTGNTKPWTFTYTIKDDTAPSIDCQTNLTFCEDVSGNYLITPANAGKDNCDGPVTVSYTISGTTTRSGTGNDASGVFNPGISTITWIVEDQCGNTNSCVTAINIQARTNPEFDPVAPVCEGEPAPALPTTSKNGISGTWSPSVINNTATTIYTFTPTPGQCANQTQIIVTVNPKRTPAFNAAGPFCQNTAAPALPATSNNGISGTWSPAVINTSQVGNTVYTFTPNPGQCASQATMSIEITNQITPTFIQIGPLCQNTTPPALPASSNNNPQITGKWNPAEINTSQTGATVYTFTPDPGQCAVEVTMTIEITTEIIPVFQPIGPLCHDSTPPSLPSLSANNPPLSGTWSPATISTNTLGTFNYIFTPDAGQCASPVTIQVEVTGENIPAFASFADLCQGDQPPVLPSISDNNIRGSWLPSLVNNQTTTRYVFTPDPDYCAEKVSITIKVNPKTTPVFEAIAPLCEGDTPPSLPLVSTNGIRGTWNPSIINNTKTLNYIFTPDAGECATQTQKTVVVNQKITPSFDQIIPICEGAVPPILPTISKNFVSGKWTPAIIDNTNTGTYIFTPDTEFCASSVQMTVAVIPLPAIPSMTVTDPTCGVATGSFVVTSPTAGLTFSLDGGAFAAYPASGYTQLNSGNHTLQVRNADGCTNSVTVTIGAAPGAPEVPQVMVTDPTCEVAIGSFVVTSPTAGLTFSLDGGAFAAYPAGGYTGLNSGNHTLQVRNADGCTNSVTVTIGAAPGAPEVPQVMVTDPTCEVAIGSFVVTSPTAGLTFSLDGGAFAAYPAGGYTGLNSGNHTLQVRNADGCTNSVTVTVGAAPLAPEVPQVAVTDPTCGVATGSFVVTSPTAGLTFSLDGGAFAAYPASGYTQLNSANHTLQVRNADGCTNSITVTIGSAPGAPEVPLVSLTDPTCEVATGSFVITSSTAGLTFSLDGGAFAAYPAGGYTGLNSGNHTLQVRNADGCTNSVTVTIGSAPGAPEVPLVSVTDPTCEVATGSFVVTSPTAGLTFSLGGNTFTAYPAGGYTGLNSGNHTLQVRNADGCTNSVNLDIGSILSIPEAPVIEITQPDNQVYTGSFIVTSTTSGLLFRLNSGAFVPYPPGGFKGLSEGEYILTVQSVEGCENFIEFSIIPAPLPPPEPTTNVIHPTCLESTGSITITSETDGLLFKINSGSFEPYPEGGYKDLQPGTYILTTKGSNGITVSVKIAIHPAPEVPDEPSLITTQPSCELPTGSIKITSSTNNLTISLNGKPFEPYPSGGYTNLSPGSYSLVVKNQYGCTNSQEIILFTAPEVPDDFKVCCGGPPIILRNLPDIFPEGGTFYWKGTAIDRFSPDCRLPGNYVITYRYPDFPATISMECSFTITVLPQPAVTNLTPSLCEDTSTPGVASNINLTDYNNLISTQPNLNFIWFKDQNLTSAIPDPGSATVSNNITFYVKVQDNQTGCHHTANVTFKVSDNLGVRNLTIDLCENTATLNEYHNLQLNQFNQEVFAGSPGTTYRWFSDAGLNRPVNQTLLPVVRHNDIYYVEVAQGSCKNVASINFAISDSILPDVRCRPHTAYLNSSGQVTVTVWDVDNESTDNCDIGLYFLNDLRQKVQQLEFDCNDLGQNMVRLYGSDPSGNTDYCEVVVTVKDTIPPTARCRPPFVIFLGPGGTYALSPAEIDRFAYDGNGSSDNCGAPSLSIPPDKAFFTCDDVGTHTVTLTVFDRSGNSDYCETQITIIGNSKPEANDDNIKVAYNQPMLILPLVNDKDPGPLGGLNPASFDIVAPPRHGTLTVNTLNGSVIYTPDRNYAGSDSFVYEICDNGVPCEVMCDRATVYLQVLPENHPPLAFDKLFEVGCNGISGNILYGIPNIHTADYDPDINDSFYLRFPLISTPNNGLLNLREDGSFFFTPQSGFSGSDFLIYAICDNGFPQMCDTARITFHVFEDKDCDDIPDKPIVNLFIPEGFSPNGDDVHDFFRVAGLEEFPDAKMMIFNRWGNKVFEKEKYGNLHFWNDQQDAWWWGEYQGRNTLDRSRIVPVGNYLYVLHLGNGKTFSGTVLVSY